MVICRYRLQQTPPQTKSSGRRKWTDWWFKSILEPLMPMIGSAEQQPSWLLHFASVAVAMATTRPHQSLVCTNGIINRVARADWGHFRRWSWFRQAPRGSLQRHRSAQPRGRAGGLFLTRAMSVSGEQRMSVRKSDQKKNLSENCLFVKINRPRIMCFKFYLVETYMDRNRTRHNK